MATFQRRRLENDWPPNPLNGGFLDCTENDFFCAWQTFQRRRLENVSCGRRSPSKSPPRGDFLRVQGMKFLRVRGKLFNVADLKTFLVGEEAPLNLPQGETF